MESRSSKAVKDFFDLLLDEPGNNVDIESQPLARLLEKVGEIAPQIDVAPELIDPSLLHESNTKSQVINKKTNVSPQVSDKKQQNEVVIEQVPKLENSVDNTVKNETGPLYLNTLPEQLDNGFPVLFFEAMGQVFSVPLVKLKGIYRKKKLSKLIGKPKWFSGVQIERDQTLNIIDTALYLMPEKFGSSLEYSPNYQYIIVIGDSNWGLECNRLIDSTTLSHDEIKWRTNITRSPWLAGTVKHRMCGLLAVDALIELFENNET
jgi:purine-binding chemotaxis protein CheW